MKSSRFSFLNVLLLFASGALWMWVAACGRTPGPPVVSDNKSMQDRFNWNYQTLVTAYDHAGYAGRAWNKSAKAALVSFARVRARVVKPDELWAQTIGTNCQAAVQAGCKDPMIAYLHVRYGLDQNNVPKTFADAFCDAAREMQQSSYPSIRKFYSSARAIEQVYFAFGTNADPQLIRDIGGGDIRSFLIDALADPNLPVEEADEAANTLYDLYHGKRDIYETLEGPIFARWSNESFPWLIKGKAHIKKAWNARGSGYAHTVTEEGWAAFAEHLRIAEEALAKAWELNTNDERIPIEMLTVELGQGKGRDRMELWFQRAMNLETNCYEACARKLRYLEPKWHGSEDDVLDFGWQCVESTTWAGTVPLILVDTHEALSRYVDKAERNEYWKRSEVWPDIRDAYEKFFTLYPEATNWLHNYARYAHRCGQWHALNQLLPKLGPVNYKYFGGKPKFDEILRQARQHSAERETKIDAPAQALRRFNVRVAARSRLGKTDPVDFADILQACNDILSTNQDPASESLADLLFAKSELCLDVFNQPDEARKYIQQLKSQFPSTRSARSADAFLNSIDQKVRAGKPRIALAIGDNFPPFSVQDHRGKPLRLDSYRGKVVLIDFWASWCRPWIAELPIRLEVYRKYHDQGFEIIGVSLDDEKEALDACLRDKQIAWPQFFDGNGLQNELASRFNIESVPATFLLDRTGKIIATDLRGSDLDQTVARQFSLEH